MPLPSDLLFWTIIPADHICCPGFMGSVVRRLGHGRVFAFSGRRCVADSIVHPSCESLESETAMSSALSCFSRTFTLYHMGTPLHCRCRWIEPGPERHLFSDTTILQGVSPVIKTNAELKLENVLQIANPSPSQSARTQPNKPHDFKPRLLLMGLRRYEL